MQDHLCLQNWHKICLSGLSLDKMNRQAAHTSVNSNAEAMFAGMRIVWHPFRQLTNIEHLGSMSMS